MKKSLQLLSAAGLLLGSLMTARAQSTRVLFDNDWQIQLDTANQYEASRLASKPWQKVQLPHDWSIEQPFDEYSPSTNGGASLRGGTAMYKKEFTVPAADKGKHLFIDFDGVYMNSTVWVNGHELGTRPNGYISFQYELTPYLNFGGKNEIKVLVHNHQPNSRWYSGSGIYRNVWLEKKGDIYVDNYGTYITTPKVSTQQASLQLQTKVKNALNKTAAVEVKTVIFDDDKRVVKILTDKFSLQPGELLERTTKADIPAPKLWSLETPHLYKAVTEVYQGGKKEDTYTTNFGIRSFHFDREKGFFLNGQSVKIVGVCMHHDLGALGSAINYRAMERQLEILKEMGINGIRTSHNPPAPEWLELCDKMGFIVMDEAFDMWKEKKNDFDYHLYWDQWHYKDLVDQVLRDRNHPSVFVWSIGNEIPEQWGGQKDTSGRSIARELNRIVDSLDNRPTTAALNHPQKDNNIAITGTLGLIGVNYHHQGWAKLPEEFPGQTFILTETVSSLQSRGEYLMPSDSIRRWAGFTKKKNGGTPDYICSAYENSSAPWGSTHEESLKLLLKYPFLSGMYIWTGFDYLGEPTPYPFPARSSYFGIVDLAGFPKDAFYLYQSLFTDKDVLHIFPHWNWKPDQKIDIWAYYNHADEVELQLNGKSLGIRKKTGDQLHVQWDSIAFTPGTLKAISRKNGKIVKVTEIHTAGKAYKLVATADRSTIKNDGQDLAFVKIQVEDQNGNLVPDADNELHFSLSGDAQIAALDNGNETDLTPYSNKESRKAYNGLGLAIIKAHEQKSTVTLTVTSPGLTPATVQIEIK
ncbi:beta-galactosidase [Arachidicoccus rhizosphaerae]|uniref:Beta-galactosidase n=1 Tax=Arachidicoccus rhizosphaerae TaxID=551991 RepID=A0A1H4B4X3_9BACT|nr:glycoside hydrolase family 2 TIM barrel-domain containing protein [Arachidicoccus rhizosphaerae]SEA43074.1 beta-galactosidase [Arachidicoccus rhizosphaerae]